MFHLNTSSDLFSPFIGFKFLLFCLNACLNIVLVVALVGLATGPVSESERDRGRESESERVLERTTTREKMCVYVSLYEIKLLYLIGSGSGMGVKPGILVGTGILKRSPH